ncbi:hypothetical protein MMC21_000244 [Puttea exsequens]|nr:hypothetical protein [Puttea exsequens]
MEEEADESLSLLATSTMVTAILPSMVASHYTDHSLMKTPPQNCGQDIAPSVSSELTTTPHRLQHQADSASKTTDPSPARLAGVVGFFTGCGALIALGLFLRLPELIQRTGVDDSARALKDTFYIVGGISLVLSILCYIGLGELNGEDGKGWRALFFGGGKVQPTDASHMPSALKNLSESITLGFTSPRLGLAYLGGFVARASSVGISLFIPLLVNAYYISSGVCDEVGRDPQDAKEHCKGAYVLAAELTGVSQLVALVFAPILGFLADKYRRFNAPLLSAALLGVVGYIGLAKIKIPQAIGEVGSLWVFVIMALLGISQIGAIVCSLGLLGREVMGLDGRDAYEESENAETTVGHSSAANGNLFLPQQTDSLMAEDEPSTPLLRARRTTKSRDYMKGSIAGVYSLSGGAGILLLTKAGGKLFDKVSPSSPFYMLAAFNLVLLAAGLAVGITTSWRKQ